MPKVSVCVPIYNVEKYIEKCARSLFEQTLDDIEYIFINDCTPDRSVEILRAVLKEYPHREAQTRIIDHTTNQGLAAARNTGLKAATGEYIIHCDSDDWVDTDMYKAMYDKAQAENADIVCCNYTEERQHKQTEYKYTSSADIHSPHFSIHPLYCAFWNKLIRRDLYTKNQIQSFEHINLWEDVGTIIRLLYLCHHVVIVPKALYHYNRTDITLSNTITLSKIKEQIRCAQKLEQFFLSKQDTSCGRLLILIKLIAKNNLLWNPESRNVALWTKIFPETHKYIISLSAIPLYQRIILWLIAHKFTHLGLGCISIINKIHP